MKERFTNVAQKTLDVFVKFASTKAITALKDGFVLSMPITLVGSIFPADRKPADHRLHRFHGPDLRQRLESGSQPDQQLHVQRARDGHRRRHRLLLRPQREDGRHLLRHPDAGLVPHRLALHADGHQRHHQGAGRRHRHHLQRPAEHVDGRQRHHLRHHHGPDRLVGLHHLHQEEPAHQDARRRARRRIERLLRDDPRLLHHVLLRDHLPGVPGSSAAFR